MLASDLEKRFVAAVGGLGLKCPKIGTPWPGRIVLKNKSVDFIYILGGRRLTVSESQQLYFLRLFHQNVVFVRTEAYIETYVKKLSTKKDRYRHG